MREIDEPIPLTERLFRWIAVEDVDGDTVLPSAVDLHRPARAEPAPSRGVLVWQIGDGAVYLWTPKRGMVGFACQAEWMVDAAFPHGFGFTDLGDAVDLHSAIREIAHRLTAAGWTVPPYPGEVGP